MATETTLKPCIELYKNGINKLETFFKIAATKDETAFMEINPQEDIIRLNCMDPAHVTQTIAIISNEDADFTITGLDKILQFNVNVRDFNKLLTLNEDKHIKIYPDLDENNNFDMLRIHISENNVNLKQIFLPIHDATNSNLFDGTIDLVNKLQHKDYSVTINMNLEFLNSILKDSEIFMNERLRWNVTIIDKKIENLSIETFDSDTDKTRRIKTNLFQGLHFNTKFVSIHNNETHKYDVLFSFSDLKKLLVSSKHYENVLISMSNKNPLVIMYNDENGTFAADNTLTCLLAPIVRDEEEPEQNNI
jgi:hypothetical protein